MSDAIKPPLSMLKPETMQLISDLLSRRQQLVNMQTMEKNRLQIMLKIITSIIKPILMVIKTQLKKVDQKLIKLIEASDEYKAKNDIIQSMPGVGNIIAFNLLSDMPELGYLTNKQAAPIIGVAPIKKKVAFIKGNEKYMLGGVKFEQ